VAERIQAKVAQILTARDLVLNKGSSEGVTVGMRFAVLNRKGADVKDPDTGEVLGSVELPKTFVKVVAVKEHLCIARTFREFKSGGGPLWSLMAATSLSAAPPQTRVETLKTDEARLKDELDEKESYVKIGDPAVQMLGEEFTGAADAGD
jgi:hypothetical protein